MPTKIGRFEIQAEIYRSTTGSVNKACDPAGGQVVVLKTVDFKPFGDRTPGIVRRILDEAETSKLLNTHNIAMLFGAGEIDGQFCATMEYVQGNSIETMLERKEVFSIWDVQDIARQSCQGLDHARVNKVLHYSLEPAKLMVQWDGVVKILSFGVSMMGAFAAEVTPGIPKILYYMSPEQLQGTPMQPSSNLFSLGAILYEMVTQQKAFDGADANLVKQAILESEPSPPSAINSKIDYALSDVIMKALAKDPAARYQSGQELINDLEKCKNAPVKSAPANKTIPPPQSLKTAQPANPASAAPQQPIRPTAAASSRVPAVPPLAKSATAQPPQNGPAKASAASAGASNAGIVSQTLQSLKARKLDPSQEFITTCVKASIDAVIQPEPKMSVATEESEMAPAIATDPTMDENRKPQAPGGRSFSEIDELPPLKESFLPTHTPTPSSDDDILDDNLLGFEAEEPGNAQQGLVAGREMAKKAITEIKKTPPKMFAYSIGIAVAIILVVAGFLYVHIRSANSDEESAAPPPAASTTPSNQPPANAPAVASDQVSSPEDQAADSESDDAARANPRTHSASRKKEKLAAPAPVPPAIIPAQLMVSSNPAGGQVQVDGRTDPNWITPYNIAGLSPGQHTVYVSKTGFAPEIRTVEAISGGKSTVSVTLRQLPATVFFISAPSGAAIFIDGKDTGRVTPSQIPLDSAGSHVFLVKKQGYLEDSTTANLTPGQIFHYSPTLTALGSTDEIKTVGKFKKLFGGNDPEGMGVVSVKIQPRGAQIAINNRLLEKSSPVDFYLNPGTYVIDVTLTGYKRVHHIVTVNRGGKVTLDETLEPQQ